MVPPSPAPAIREPRPRQPRRAHANAAAELLARAGRVLAGSLDFGETVRNLASLAVPHLADWCVVDVLGDAGRPREVEVAAAGPAQAAALRRSLGDAPHGGRLGAAMTEVLSTGRARLLAHGVEEAACVAGALSGGQAPRSCLVAPLAARDRVIGALALVRTGRRPFGRPELAAAEELGVMGGLALHNAILYAQAQRATRMRDEVLGVVAHDLRNPLMAISMYAHVLSETGLSAKQEEWLEVMLRNTERMNALIQDLLDITALKAGRLRVQPAPCATGPLLAEAVQTLEPQARARGVRLSSRMRGELPPVRADRERVLQVLSNLAGNAVKFTPAGGEVELAAEARGAEVVITVRDDGPGIEAADLPRVFDRFWQAAGTRRGGAGLGLSIARGIVESHGGRIWAESVPGQGSTFSFTLPAAQDAPDQPGTVDVHDPPAAEEAAACDVVRVLLVDDHPFIRRGLRELLRHTPGMVVAGEAETADEAVRAAVELGPDVVLLDLNLPGGGLNATRRILAERPSMRVLILTAEPDDGCVRAALEAGAGGYLRKSVEPTALLAALRAVRGGELVLDAGLRGWAADAASAPARVVLSTEALRVLALNARGYGGPEIAARLAIPVRAVNQLRTRSMRALGLSTRAELMRYALDAGWLGAGGCAETDGPVAAV
ncbi:MAG TPA: ATP-binding protein, partial [Longimicrobium sp.]|nr:ATP-binding protein [Longimicrobium sp.]